MATGNVREGTHALNADRLAVPLADLVAALQDEAFDAHAPAVVIALAGVLRAGQYTTTAAALVETEQDTHPDEWAAHARWELAARTAQHDEDTTREEL